VPTEARAHGGLKVVPDLAAVGALEPPVVAPPEAERQPADAGQRAHQHAGPEYLGAADLPHLIKNSPLVAVDASGENIVDRKEELRRRGVVGVRIV
jgi:hypothetical protein